MTETDAKNFVQRCGRWCLGRKNLSCSEIIRRTRTNCVTLSILWVGTVVNVSLGFKHPLWLYAWTYGFALMALSIIIWLLLRLRRSENVLRTQYQFVK
jgi:hypothetical protein